MRFDLVVFDLDGTLIDTIGDIADAVNAALADFRLPAWPDEAVATMVGEGALQLVERAIAGRLPDERTPEVLQRYTIHYDQKKTGRTRMYPGVVEGLRRLAPVK